MERTIEDRIGFIKTTQERHCLTAHQIFEICDKRGKYVSEKTISRMLKEGSEDGGFHLHSIVSVYEALYEEYDDDDADDVKALKQKLAYREQQIDNLLLQIEIMQKGFKEKVQLYEDRKQAYQQTIALFERVLNEHLIDKDK